MPKSIDRVLQCTSQMAKVDVTKSPMSPMANNEFFDYELLDWLKEDNTLKKTNKKYFAYIDQDNVPPRHRKPNCHCFPICNTWIQFYFTHGGKNAQKCCAMGCNKGIDVITQALINNSRIWYVIPFCYDHNTNLGKIEVKAQNIWVKADQQY
jgi:hypothetical protein